MKGSLIAVAAATIMVDLVAAPNASEAKSSAAVDEQNNKSEAPATAAQDDNHTPIGGSCKGYVAFCRSDRECCRPYLCLRDRRRGGFSCM